VSNVAPTDDPQTRSGRGRTAILIVNGYDREEQGVSSRRRGRGRSVPGRLEDARRFPWIGLCLEQIARHTDPAAYQVFVWDNSFLPEHLEIIARHPQATVYSEAETQRDVPHGRALDRLFLEVSPGTEYVVTLDTDSFPIRDGWLENLVGRLEAGAALAGVWRDEMFPKVLPYVHPSCLAIRSEMLRELGIPFHRRDEAEVGQNLTTAVIAAGRTISRLRRSNVREVHYVLGGIYGDLVYHHGAGSRRAAFHYGFDPRRPTPCGSPSGTPRSRTSTRSSGSLRATCP
jgi:hypothetical protein